MYSGAITAGRARARCADGADIAEDILEEAAFAAERRRLVAFGADLADQLEPGAIDRGDISRFIETDAQNLLVDRARPREGELARFARDVIIFVREIGRASCRERGCTFV